MSDPVIPEGWTPARDLAEAFAVVERIVRRDERARLLREMYERAPAIVNGTLGFTSTVAIARFRDCVNFATALLAPEGEGDDRKTESIHHAASSSGDEPLGVLVEVWHVLHEVVLDDDGAQERHQRAAGLATRALVQHGVLVPGVMPEPVASPSVGKDGGDA